MSRKKSRKFLFWGIFLLFNGVAFSQPANIYTFDPGVRITDVPPDEVGTSSLFRSSGQHYTAFRGDTVYVVWWESRIVYPPTGNHVFLAKSTDGGATFGPSIRVNDLPAGFNPSMRVDSSGNIYVAYQRQGNIYFTKSTDGGNSFTPSVLVVDPAGLDSLQEIPSIAVNNKGQVFIAWIDKRTNPQSVFTTASYDGGQSFRPNVQVGHGYRSVSSGFDIGIDEGGRVYVAYEDTLGDLYGIVVCRSVDSGQSFSSYALASQRPLFVNTPSMAVSSNGLVGIAYEQYGIRFSLSSDSGRTFSPSVRVDTGYTEEDCGFGDPPSLCTSNGMFYVTWDDGRVNPTDSGCYHNLFFSYSSNQGHSFATEVGGGGPFSNISSSVAVNEEGKGFVAWIDDREDPVFQGIWRVFGATLNPNFIKGDLNLDGKLSPADVAMELNAVFLGRPFPAPFESADGNCDTELTPADVALQINAVFLGEPFPC